MVRRIDIRLNKNSFPNTTMRKSLWSPHEDEALTRYVQQHGSGNWNEVVTNTGLNRGPKSCRLRWMNYLRPGLKRSPFSRMEARLLLRLHRLLGNSWSHIASYLPGRSDNDVKNFWHTYARRSRSRLASKQHLKTSSTNQPKISKDDQQMVNDDKHSTDRKSVHDADDVKMQHLQPNSIYQPRISEDDQQMANDDKHSIDQQRLHHADKRSIDDVKLLPDHNDNQMKLSAINGNLISKPHRQIEPRDQDDDVISGSSSYNCLYSPASSLPTIGLNTYNNEDQLIPHKGGEINAPEGLYLIVWKFLNPNPS